LPAVLAGLFLFIFSLAGPAFNKAEAAGLLNSQNLGLRAGSAWSVGPRGGADITIVGGALLAETGPGGNSADSVVVPASDQISIYVVRSGDTLSQVATMFGVSVNTIIWANDLPANGKIVEGQTLAILPITGVRHTVAKGETLASIAKKYQGDLGEIAQFNGLDPEGPLAVDTTLIIPDGQAPTPPRFVGVPARPGSPVTDSDGYFVYPLARRGVKTQGLHGYNGVDLAAPAGTPIVAAASGRVLVSRNSGWNGGYGHYIVIEHPNGTQTLYAHNRENIVSAGQSVVQGQVIGYVGSTGRSTGSHVHFEVRGGRNPF
jgi:murein DD-endopeptidase MepM/ murein hydrolase activator NlpD